MNLIENMFNHEPGIHASNVSNFQEAIFAFILFENPYCGFFHDYGYSRRFRITKDADLYRSFHFRGKPGLEIRMNCNNQVMNKWKIPPSGFLNTTPFVLGTPLICAFFLYAELCADEPFYFEACKSVVDPKVIEKLRSSSIVAMNTNFNTVLSLPEDCLYFLRYYNNNDSKHNEHIEKFKKIHQERRFDFLKGHIKTLILASKRDGPVQRFFNHNTFDPNLLILIEEYSSKWSKRGYVDNYVSSFKNSTK